MYRTILLRLFSLLLFGCYAVTSLELSTSEPGLDRTGEIGQSTSFSVSIADSTISSIEESSTFLQTEVYETSPPTDEVSISSATGSSSSDSSNPVVLATCPESDQIHCKNSDRCTRIRYICDGDNDCGDNSDEDPALCRLWNNPDCERNQARCRRNGRNDCVSMSQYCSVSDPPCEGSVDIRICHMLKNEKLQNVNDIEITTTPLSTMAPVATLPSVHYEASDYIDEFRGRLDFTIRHKDCPQLYTRIGDQCVSLFIIGNLTWMESRAFCQAIGGDLWTIKPNLSNFLTLLQHLTLNQITKDFWIGGMYINSTSGWQWIDDTSIPVGSPIWAVRYNPICSSREVTSPVLNITSAANDGACYHFVQAPRNPPTGQCGGITYNNFYYVSDEDCLTRKSPLCVMPDEHPKQGI